jgi:hypothetical protein
MFSLDAFKTPSLTMGSIRNWAAEVCSSHLGEGKDPTACLTKIAHENNLTTHQVEVLAGEINKVIHTAKFASVEEKYHAADFPLADSRKAIEELQLAPEEKVASVGGWDIPDPIVNRSIDYDAAFGVGPEEMSKTASERILDKKQLDAATVQMRKISQEIYETEQMKLASEARFIKEARQYVLDGADKDERISKLCELDHMSKCASVEKAAAKPLAKLARVLAAEHLIPQAAGKTAATYFLSKLADEKAPLNLISPYLKARVVNGNHPLIVSIKTHSDACDKERELIERSKLIKDRLELCDQKVRAL